MEKLEGLTLALVVSILFYGSAYLGYRIASRTNAIVKVVVSVLAALLASVAFASGLQHNGYQSLGCYVGVGSTLVFGGLLVGLLCSYNPFYKAENQRVS